MQAIWERAKETRHSGSRNWILLQTAVGDRSAPQGNSWVLLPLPTPFPFLPTKEGEVPVRYHCQWLKDQSQPPAASMPGSPQHLAEQPWPQSLHTISETAPGEGEEPPTFAAYHQLRALCFITANLTVPGCPAVGNDAYAVNFRVYSQHQCMGN